MSFNKKALIDTALAALCLTLVAIFQFHNISDKHLLMEAGDSPPSRAHDQKANLHEGFVMGWNPYAGPGAPGEVAPPDWQTLVYWFAPEMKAAECIMAISLILAALFFYLFLRERGYSQVAALIGGTVFGFSPSIATFTFAGHVGRFVMTAYAGGAFWATQRAMKRRSIPAAIWAGLFMAYAMMNDGTTGLLMMLGLAVLVLRDLIEIGRASRAALIQVGIRLAIVGAIAIAVIAPQAAYLKAALSEGSDQHSEKQDAQAHREWAMQWSYPPQELLAFVSAGYYGIDSWNDRQPYWGRLGRTFHWETKHEGYPNFSQTNAYLGLISIILLITGLILHRKRLRRATLHDLPGAPTSDTIFWLVLGFVSLVTSFGRYFSLPFEIFTSLPLPLLSSFRNPVKFLVLINLCTAVLAAQGAEALVASAREGKLGSTLRPFRCVAAVAAGFAALFLLIMMTEPWSTASFQNELSTLLACVPAFQGVIQSIGMQGMVHQVVASMKAALMTGLGWSFLIATLAGVASAPSIGGLAKRPMLLPVILGLLLAFDFIGVNRRYVRYENVRTQYADNAILSDLRSFPDYRVKLIPTREFPLPQTWAIQHSRLNGIRSIDGEGPPAGVLPLMQALEGVNPGRLSDLLGIRHILIPRPYTNAIRQITGNDAHEIKGYAINRGMTPGQYEITPSMAGTGPLALMENASAYPTPKWYSNAKAGDKTDALAMLADPAFNPETTLIVDAPPAEISAHQCAGPSDARYLLDEFAHNRIRIKGASSQPGWLMINEPWHASWQAEVDGKPVTIRPAFGYFRAIPVEHGEHTVVLTYRPKATMFWMPLGMVGAATLISAGSLAIRRKSPTTA